MTGINVAYLIVVFYDYKFVLVCIDKVSWLFSYLLW